MDGSFHKSINFFTLTMIAVGACIGSGIFISPSDVAAQLHDGADVLLVWGIGGAVALTGALTFAEMASRFPGTGGVYVYLREAYGPLAAFLYGWCILTVITSGAIAALCLAFARYLGLVAGWPDEAELWTGLAALAVVTLVNVRGVAWSAILSNFTTLVKVVGIAAVVLVALFAGRMFGENVGLPPAADKPVSFGLALIGVLWSYGGWHHASYVGGEVRDAGRIVPRALIAGALIVTIVYMAVNAGYLALLPMSEIASSKAVAAEALMRVTAVGGTLIAVLIAISTFGTAGIYTLSAPRIYFTMGADKVFFPWLADIHAAFGTPAKAIALQSAWAAVLMIFWGTFENLVTYVVFMDWIFMTLAAIGLFYFRRRHDKFPAAGYRVPGYPIIPVIFIGISLWFLASTLLGRPEQAIAGLVLMAVGWPVYRLFRRTA
jgi:APA family basic amino acid/polyamine antiporter